MVNKMKNYGMPYMGNKSTIAEKLIELLPSGKRFVDLFGGGGAMSHCALLSGKYETVYYNELNSIVVDVIKKAINGDYNYDRFKPEFITREKFFDLKDKDGYVAYIWSFGNKGDTYLFGKDIEKQKQALHNAVVFEDYSEAVKICPDLIHIKGDNLKERRLTCKKIIAEKIKSKPELQQLEQLQRLERLQQLQQLEQLQQLQQLERLEINCGSYLDYNYQKGDVVYCDPPYENTAKYCKDGFDHKEFYDWVFTREYPVYFSSYEISDNRFFRIYEQTKRETLSSHGNGNKKVEVLYCNKQDKLTLF